MKPIRKGTQKAIIFPQFPSIMAQEDSDDDDDQGTMHMGDIAEKYLRQFFCYIQDLFLSRFFALM